GLDQPWFEHEPSSFAVAIKYPGHSQWLQCSREAPRRYQDNGRDLVLTSALSFPRFLDGGQRRTGCGAAATLGGPARPTFSAEPVIKVHKDPNCGCCSGWVQHLRDAAFTVEVDDAADLPSVRKRLGVPLELTACHTAEVSGYILEGPGVGGAAVAD